MRQSPFFPMEPQIYVCSKGTGSHGHPQALSASDWHQPKPPLWGRCRAPARRRGSSCTFSEGLPRTESSSAPSGPVSCLFSNIVHMFATPLKIFPPRRRLLTASAENWMFSSCDCSASHTGTCHWYGPHRRTCTPLRKLWSLHRQPHSPKRPLPAVAHLELSKSAVPVYH